MRRKILIFILLLISIFTLDNVVFADDSLGEAFDCSLKVKSGDTVFLDSSDKSNCIKMYDTVLLDMDIVFPYMEKAYGVIPDGNYVFLLNKLSELFYYTKSNSVSTKRHTAYRKFSLDDSSLILNRDKLNLFIPDVYYYVASSLYTIDDSLNIDIEKVNIDGVDHYYLPVYLFANIPGVSVSVYGHSVYNASNYMDSISALNNSSSHDIVLDVSNVTDYSSILSTIDNTIYYGEENGALWREEAKKKIEKYRKSGVNITVTDKSGNKVEGAKISVKMISNDFKFGTAIRENNGVNDYDGISGVYFNTLGSENLFKFNQYYVWDGNISDFENKRKDIITTGNKLGISNFRGHVFFWDRSQPVNSQLTGFRSIIGTELDNDPNNITMAYVYNKYNSFIADNDYTESEEAQVNEWISEIKDNFKNLVFDYIKNTLSNYPEVTEWDLFNELRTSQFFKHYLFDEAFLSDKKFLSITSFSPVLDEEISINDEFIDFLAECVSVFRQNSNALLVANENYINANRIDSDNDMILQTIDILKRINNKSKIDALGIQYHVGGREYFTPTSYNNSIDKALELTGIGSAKITEYDNYKKDSNGFVYADDATKQKRANYMKDTLLAAYSNMNVNEFSFWVFNYKEVGQDSNIQERITDPERDAYKNTVYDWLNYSENGDALNGLYNTRLYKGKYIVTVNYNGKDYNKQIVVLNDNSINFVVDEQVVSVDNTFSSISKIFLYISVFAIFGGFGLYFYSVYLSYKNRKEIK